jgi:hypothetical protein
LSKVFCSISISLSFPAMQAHEKEAAKFGKFVIFSLMKQKLYHNQSLTTWETGNFLLFSMVPFKFL